MLEGQRRLFAGPFEWRLIEGAGHFLQEDKGQEIGALLAEWLASDAAS